MRQGKPIRQRLSALALCGTLLLTFPFLSLPSGEWFGLPALFVYVFGVWAGLIVAAAWLIESEDD